MSGASVTGEHWTVVTKRTCTRKQAQKQRQTDRECACTHARLCGSGSYATRVAFVPVLCACNVLSLFNNIGRGEGEEGKKPTRRRRLSWLSHTAVVNSSTLWRMTRLQRLFKWFPNGHVCHSNRHFLWPRWCNLGYRKGIICCRNQYNILKHLTTRCIAFCLIGLSIKSFFFASNTGFVAALNTVDNIWVCVLLKDERARSFSRILGTLRRRWAAEQRLYIWYLYIYTPVDACVCVLVLCCW